MVVHYIPGVAVPPPMVDFDNQGFWDGVKRHELVIQKCHKCGSFHHPPRPMCPKCLAMDMEWVPSTGKGIIYSWITVAYAKSGHPAMEVPYSVVLVELEEGVRLASNVVGMAPEDIYIGMPVKVIFEDINQNLTLYKFKKND